MPCGNTKPQHTATACPARLCKKGRERKISVCKNILIGRGSLRKIGWPKVTNAGWGRRVEQQRSPATPFPFATEVNPGHRPERRGPAEAASWLVEPLAAGSQVVVGLLRPWAGGPEGDCAKKKKEEDSRSLYSGGARAGG